MSTLTINGTSYTDFVSAFGTHSAPQTGNYFACGEFGDPPVESAPMYDDRLIKFPGNFQIGRKRIYYEGRKIHAELIIVAANKASAASTAATQMTSFMQLARYTITLPDGVSRPNCYCTNAAITKWLYWQDFYACVVSAEFLQLVEPT